MSSLRKLFLNSLNVISTYSSIFYSSLFYGPHNYSNLFHVLRVLRECSPNCEIQVSSLDFVKPGDLKLFPLPGNFVLVCFVCERNVAKNMKMNGVLWNLHRQSWKQLAWKNMISLKMLFWVYKSVKRYLCAVKLFWTQPKINKTLRITLKLKITIEIYIKRKNTV